ncbi:heavy metal translocating P-type ATPase [Chloroflexi bacterium TSY]|nr:heavy metal translocating P-type ATPase [Chloroflexi bacterium TSY]
MEIATSLLKGYKKQQKKRRVHRYLRDAYQSNKTLRNGTLSEDEQGNHGALSGIQTLSQSIRWSTFRQRSLAQIQTLGTEAGDSDFEDVKGMLTEEEAIDRNLIASLAGLGLATTGMFFYLPIAWLSVPFTVYASIDVLRDATDALIEERKLRHSLLDATVIVSALLSQYYLASAMASLTYYTGCKLMAMTEDNARQSLFKIMGEQPQVVWRLVDGAEVETPFEELQVGDVIVVNTGDTLPVDGIIVDGLASVDQRLLTGEGLPVEKESGAPVYAGTTLLAGRVCVQVEKAGTDTAAAQIGEILLRTTDFKSSIQAHAEEISDRSVLPTLGLSALTLATLGPNSAVAVIGSNYAEVLRIVGPLGMLNFLALASQENILFKDGRALELLNQVDTIVFDKTGTLTLEQPQVASIHTWHDFDNDELLALAAAAEQRQNHPLARAIIEAAQNNGLDLPTIDDSRYEVGYGIKAVIGERDVHVGSLRFMALSEIPIEEDVYIQQGMIHEQGNSLVHVAIDGLLVGAIELQATVRPEAMQIIQQLKARNLNLYIVSGDHQEPTRRLASLLGIENYVAEVLPEEKAKWVKRLQADGHFVCFVGDGINDAIALKQAHTSISLRGSSAVATNTAQIILTDESLTQLVCAFELAQQFNQNMRNSYITTFGPGVLCLGGIFFFNLGILSAMITYNASLIAGLSNALLPVFQQENGKSHPFFARHKLQSDIVYEDGQFKPERLLDAGAAAEPPVEDQPVRNT